MTGFGRGKVILLGEHAVVHGYPAIAAGIERGVTAHAASSEADVLSLSPWNVEVRPDSNGEPLARAFAGVLENYPERSSLAVHAEVGLPAGAGLGCSAAIGVAVIDAIDEAIGCTRNREELARAAYDWERVFHGNPSGVDNTMSAIGGIALFQKGSPLEILVPNKVLHLAIGYSGESPSTKVMVDSVAHQLASDPVRVRKAFEGIEVLVKNARFAIEAGDLVALGQLFDLNHAILSSLMLCTTRLDRMCQVAREAGALGAKMTGGGGGGCMIALAPKHEQALRICDALGDEAFITEVAA